MPSNLCCFGHSEDDDLEVKGFSYTSSDFLRTNSHKGEHHDYIVNILGHFTNSQQKNLTLLLPQEGLYVPGLQTAGGDAMARGLLALRRRECLQRFTHTAFQKLQSDKNMMTNWEWLQKESSRWGYWHFSHFWAPRGQKSFQRQEGIFRLPDEFKVREGSVISIVIRSLVDKGHTMTSLKISKRRCYMDNSWVSFEGHTHHSWVSQLHVT